MFNDLRHGVRVLLQARGWTLVVVLSLALGIGANTAIFSAVNGLLLKTIPVKDPETLVRLKWAGRNDMVTSSSDYGNSSKDAQGRDVRSTFSYPMFQQFQADNRTMSDLVACAPTGRMNVVIDGQADLATSFISTGNYYRVLGINAMMGRTIVPEDDKPDASPVAVISARYWRTRFGSAADVVGKVVTANNVRVTIVGVLPPEFTGIQLPLAEAPDISVPLALDSQVNQEPSAPSGARVSARVAQPTYWWLQVMGRLKPGATAAQVQGNLEGVFQQTARAGMSGYLSSLSDEERSFARNRDRTEVPQLRVDSGSRGIYDPSPATLRTATILGGVVLLVLLLVCANVANLLLSRASARAKEISVRLSMGATRWRIVRQLLTESLLLAAMGGTAGILVGYWGRRLLPGAANARGHEIDWRVLAFVIGVTVVTGIVFGIAPALRATGVNVSAALKDNSRTVIASRSLLGKSLLVAQVAISLVLLVGAGLFLRTVQNLRAVDVGFDPRNLVTFRVNPILNRYDDQRTRALYEQMLERLRTAPGVRAATLSNVALLSGSVNGTGIFVRGRVYPPGRRADVNINRLVVAPNFFETMGIRLHSGRAFTARDSENAPKVAIINEAAVRKYFPGEEPIGQRIGNNAETSGQMEIVGVLRDAKYNSVRDPAPPTLYVPSLQTRMPGAVFQVRTAGDPAAAVGGIREVVRRIDANLPITDVFTQMEQVERRFEQEKLFSQALALFGALAMIVASVGLFGLMSYSVSRRTNEIGIRMALGAQRRDVLGLVMRESMVLVAAGVIAGLALALGTSRFVATLLFGLAPTDAVTIGAAMTVMIMVAALAGYLPARRASRVDPMVALRYE